MPRQKVHLPQQDGTILSAFPVVPRNEQCEYLPWKEIVLAGGKVAGEILLKKLYAENWDAVACREMMTDCNLFGLPKVRKTYRRVELDMDATEKRLAVALFKECARLLARRQAPGAREFTLKTQENCRAVIMRE